MPNEAKVLVYLFFVAYMLSYSYFLINGIFKELFPLNKRSLENFVVHFEKAELSPIADMQVHILNYRVIALILVNIVLAVFFLKERDHIYIYKSTYIFFFNTSTTMLNLPFCRREHMIVLPRFWIALW